MRRELGLHRERPILGHRPERWHAVPAAAVERLRLRVEPGAVAFDDVVCGRQSFDVSAPVGDFPLRRTDGVAAYQLAVVVDDALQGVTDVVRGADLLASTAWQIALQHALDLPALKYLHLPVLTERDGGKLAKSRHAASVSEVEVIPALQQTLRWLRQDWPTLETTQPDEWLRRAALSWDPTRFAGIAAVAIDD